MLWRVCFLVLLANTSKPSVIGSFNELSNLPLQFLPRGNVSTQCQKQSEAVQRGVQQIQLWALKILDATAKVPSGILNGNNNQFGDFDLCLSAESQTATGHVKGQYCLVDFDITLKDEYKDFDERIHAKRSMTSEINDPGQRLPKLGSWRWGVCVPSACGPMDVQGHLAEVLNQTFRDVATVNLRLDSDMCYVAEKPSLGAGHYITISIFTILIVSVVLGTLWDNPARQLSNTRQIVTCFSLRRNWANLTKTTNESDDIEIIHGARAFNALGLLLSHKQMAQLFNPYVNSLQMSQAIDGEWSMIGRAAILYTDSFIFISGLLTSYSMIKQLDRDKKLDLRKSVITRYIRFTPNLLVIILTSTYLIDFFGPGPQWGLVVSKYSDLCKSNMWRNLLYIHNYFGFEDMCLTHTHQLGIDMQLFLISPIFVYLLWKNKKWGIVALTTAALLSTWLRYTVTIQHQLSSIIYYGIPVSQLFRTARLSYILPTHRMTVYCIGLLLGYAARRGIGHRGISRLSAWLGWTVATSMATLAMFGPAHMAKYGYVYNATEAAAYNAFAPILWCSFLAWCAIAGWNNRGGWVNDLLTWKYFTIFSKISYAFYLVQFPVFFYNVGVQRTSLYFHGIQGMIDIKELALIFAMSVALTLVVDMPFQNIRKYHLNNRNIVKRKYSQNEDKKMRQMNHG